MADSKNVYISSSQLIVPVYINSVVLFFRTQLSLLYRCCNTMPLSKREVKSLEGFIKNLDAVIFWAAT